VNTSGQLVIKPQFDTAGDFHEGLAVIGLGPSPFYPHNPLNGYIDPSGKMVIPAQYVTAGDFSEGVASVCKLDWSACGYIDRDGKIAIPMQFGRLMAFSEGLAGACIGNCFGQSTESEGKGKDLEMGKWGFIDHSGHFVINPQYAYVQNFENGIAKVFVGKLGEPSKFGYIDKTGKTIWQPSN